VRALTVLQAAPLLAAALLAFLPVQVAPAHAAGVCLAGTATIESTGGTVTGTEGDDSLELSGSSAQPVDVDLGGSTWTSPAVTSRCASSTSSPVWSSMGSWTWRRSPHG
jgi:hypothetical protein